MDYTKEEAETRLQAALRGSRITGRKPMSDLPKKRPTKKPIARKKPAK
jgi:hypothetical protein